MHNTSFLTLIFAAAILPLQAQSTYTSGHGDIGLAYEDSEFEPHWHLGAGAVVDGSPLVTEEEYGPDAIIARTTATRSSPSGLSSAIGVADGTEIFAMGSSSYLPNLGFAVEELDFDDWTGDISLTLTDWSIPDGAEFALYTTNLADTTVVDVAFSTFNVGATYDNNTLSLTPGDHVHFQWGLTTPGQYDFEFTWEGTNVLDGFKTASAFFSVQAVPEPATTALLLSVLTLGLVALRRSRKA